MSRQFAQKIYDETKMAAPFAVRFSIRDTQRLNALAGDKRIKIEILRLALKKFLDSLEEEETML